MVKVLISAYYNDILIDRYITNISINQYRKYCKSARLANGTRLETLILY